KRNPNAEGVFVCIAPQDLSAPLPRRARVCEDDHAAVTTVVAGHAQESQIAVGGQHGGFGATTPATKRPRWRERRTLAPGFTRTCENAGQIFAEMHKSGVSIR